MLKIKVARRKNLVKWNCSLDFWSSGLTHVWHLKFILGTTSPNTCMTFGQPKLTFEIQLGTVRRPKLPKKLENYVYVLSCCLNLYPTYINKPYSPQFWTLIPIWELRETYLFEKHIHLVYWVNFSNMMLNHVLPPTCFKVFAETLLRPPC